MFEHIYNKGYKEYMSTHTNKIDSNIIELAKQRYESKQRSKLPSIIVSLASAGKIYPESSPLRTGQIEMRYMTAYDEDILTNTSYIKNGVVFDKLLESIIVTEGVDVQEISTFDKNGLIIYSRILSYGSEYPVQIKDPETGNMLDRIINLQKIGFKSFDLQCDENGEFNYDCNGTPIKFSYNTKLNLLETTVTEMLGSVIKQVGDSRKTDDIANFIRYELLAKDSRNFRLFFLENAPGIDLTYEFEGETGGTFTAGFQIGSDLFWF
jgi:hypothetical protein